MQRSFFYLTPKFQADPSNIDRSRASSSSFFPIFDPKSRRPHLQQRAQKIPPNLNLSYFIHIYYRIPPVYIWAFVQIEWILAVPRPVLWGIDFQDLSVFYVANTLFSRSIISASSPNQPKSSTQTIILRVPAIRCSSLVKNSRASYVLQNVGIYVFDLDDFQNGL